MLSFAYVLSSLMNFPIVYIGDNAIGLFDFFFLLMLLATCFYSKKLYVNEFTIFYLMVFGLCIMTSLRYLMYLDLPSIAYILKILQISFIPSTISIFGNMDVEKREKIIFYSLLISFIYINYDHFSTFTRGRVPFMYNGSGPLGLVATVFLFIGFYSASPIRKSVLIIMGVQLLLISLSKTFIFSMCIIAFLLALKYYKVFFKIRNIIIGLLIVVSVISVFLEMGYLRKFIIIYDTVVNLREQTTFIERVDNHWFVNWDEHLMSQDSVFGHGVTNIGFSYDSLYFYSFYVFGILGCAGLILSLVVLMLNGSTVFKYYILILLTSGLFLETALISYRGLEPFILFLSYYTINNITFTRNKVSY